VQFGWIDNCNVVAMTITPTNLFGEFTVNMDTQEYLQQHKRILDNLAIAVFLVDASLCVKYLNPAAEMILGTGIRHALGKPLTDFLQDTDGELITRTMHAIETGHPFTQREVRMKRFGVDEIIIDCSATPMLVKGKESITLLEISQVDRMLRISREEHLLAETQATQNMLRGLAHEIKNPLGGLRGAAQLLAGELMVPDLCEYTDVIIRSRSLKKAGRSHAWS